VGPLSVEQVLAAEVDAIRGPQARKPSPPLHGLVTEQKSETDRANKDADTRSGKNEAKSAVDKRKEFYRELNKLNRAALCCSGGGIRSATFCLGVVQSLARYIIGKRRIAGPVSELNPTDTIALANQSLLSRIHYLSTVSGGGYIGSWLSAWRTRDDFQTVWKNLAGRPEGPDVEPPEISWLRAYSNYLTPQLGLASADTWAGAAIFLRNLILNWLVIVPAIAVVLLILKVIAALFVEVSLNGGLHDWHIYIGAAGIILLIIAQGFTTRHRPTRREKPKTASSAENPKPPTSKAGPEVSDDPRNVTQKQFLYRGLFWGLISAILVTSFLTSVTGVAFVSALSKWWAIGKGAGIGLGVFAVGWLFGWPANRQFKDFLSWAGSGLLYGALVGFGAYLFVQLAVSDVALIWKILIVVTLGIPWVLISQLLAEMIFIGLVSYELNSDADREWLGRCAGWVAGTAVIWAGTTFVVIGGSYFLIDSGLLAEARSFVSMTIAAAGGVAGIVAALIGKSSHTSAKPGADDQGFKAIALKIGLAIAGPIFAIVLVIGISVALDLLLLGPSLLKALASKTSINDILCWLVLIGLVPAIIVACTASYCVNINRFSLHALYRNRLVRAYLGATRQKRSPDKLTGFDGEDNLPSHKLWPPKSRVPNKPATNTFCLFHVVNITLNVVKSTRLAWQERKAESFTVSPLHCGAAFKGYRPSVEYGGTYQGRACGLSLGTAMAISGAAASPNMGYHSSTSITLLLALFNVRLGWWLGNPGKEGENTYTKEGPNWAIRPLVEETFGQTTDEKPWVYLSDGGHFENLGLYEMVRRRCRQIIVVDAGCDPDFAFDDLGNAVRKIYIDLGVRITFEGLVDLKNRPGPGGAQSNHKFPTGGDGAITKKSPDDDDDSNINTIPYHAIGHIHYQDADGGDCEDGTIIYIKPAVHFSDNEGAGVRSYATANKTFPHETTGDQFFSESQFESYRTLGLDIMNNVLYGGIGRSAVQRFLKGLSDTTHE
jgi:hypothetical protein